MNEIIKTNEILSIFVTNKYRNTKTEILIMSLFIIN